MGIKSHHCKVLAIRAYVSTNNDVCHEVSSRSGLCIGAMRFYEVEPLDVQKRSGLVNSLQYSLPVPSPPHPLLIPFSPARIPLGSRVEMIPSRLGC